MNTLLFVRHGLLMCLGLRHNPLWFPRSRFLGRLAGRVYFAVWSPPDSLWMQRDIWVIISKTSGYFGSTLWISLCALLGGRNKKRMLSFVERSSRLFTECCFCEIFTLTLAQFQLPKLDKPQLQSKQFLWNRTNSWVGTRLTHLK